VKADEIQRLFAAAAELPEEQQARYVAAQTDDPQLEREVLSLLTHHRLAEPFFADVFESAAASLEQALELNPGARLGAYTIEGTLGRGGMGAVYLAKRADGAFEHDVAIKVVRVSNALPHLRERFRQERQILARLNHPNVARLLDGGETDGGLLYFVLEYVRGQDIVRYCESRSLTLIARLQIFLQVCAGVQSAHENLIIHRDLKPGNILVDQAGVPKLLDFGVAKVLEPFKTGSGDPSTRLFTMEYASPEQIRGDAITTAADVYSLGAILYELLNGSPLRSSQNLSPLEMLRVISEQAAPAAAGVPEEVAAILRKALHTDPARRYRSAHDFGSDIECFLSGRPVQAVPDSMAYRARKFLRRNWIPATAIAAVVVALTAGAGVALWQGHLASRRFTEVRQLSNRFLFEFEEAIHSVAGATKARELVIKTAQEYLNRLASEAGRDPDLIRELAESYAKLGDVQGSPVQGNIGDTTAALASYRRALEMRDALGDSRSSLTNVRIAYRETLSKLASMEARAGDAAVALRLVEKEVALCEAWVQAAPNEINLVLAAANAYADLFSRQSDDGKFAAAAANARRSLDLKKRVLDLDSTDMKKIRAVGIGYWGVADAEKLAGNPEGAVENFTKSVDFMRQVADADPANFSSRREWVVAVWRLAASTKDLLRKQQRDLAAAVPLFEETLRMARQLLREDPDNALVEEDIAGISLNLGSTLQQVGRPADALAVLQPIMESRHRRLQAAPGNRAVAYNLALLHMWAADSHKNLRDLAGALKDRRGAMELLDRVAASNPSNYSYQHQKADNLRETGDLLAATGDYAGARAYYRTGLEIAEKLPSGPASLDRTALIAELQTSSQRIAKK
jgi:eukaryotic-like serine/threonine-protein kinase